jgi:hypothetical protein
MVLKLTKLVRGKGLARLMVESNTRVLNYDQDCAILK